MAKILLAKQEPEIVKCEKCEHTMVNIDADQLQTGDLLTLKKAGLRVSNPETTDPICLNCEVDTWGHRLARWFETDDSDDDNDDHFFGGGSSSGGLFGGGGSSSGGGFGGFGGGSFSGGGASSSW